MRKDSAEKLSGNDQFEGYAVDLAYEISKTLGFNYTIRLVPDGRYGSYNKETGEWDGMVRELLEQRADIAVGDLTITYEREQAVDFTMPFMNLGISVLYRKPVKQPPNLFSFLSPLSLDVWIYMATAYLGVSILLFILARFTPYEWQSPGHPGQHPDKIETQFTLMNCMWFAIGSLMQQGCDFLPKYVRVIPFHCCSLPIAFCRALQGRFNAYGRRHVVVLHADHDLVVHGQLGCILDRRADGLADRERRGFGETDENQVRRAQRRLDRLILSRFQFLNISAHVVVHGERSSVRFHQQQYGGR